MSTLFSQGKTISQVELKKQDEEDPWELNPKSMYETASARDFGAKPQPKLHQTPKDFRFRSQVAFPSLVVLLNCQPLSKSGLRLKFLCITPASRCYPVSPRLLSNKRSTSFQNHLLRAGQLAAPHPEQEQHHHFVPAAGGTATANRDGS